MADHFDKLNDQDLCDLLDALEEDEMPSEKPEKPLDEMTDEELDRLMEGMDE